MFVKIIKSGTNWNFLGLDFHSRKGLSIKPMETGNFGVAVGEKLCDIGDTIRQ